MPGNSKPAPAAAPELPGTGGGYSYKLISREEVRTIAKQKEPETKRMNINVPTGLHNAFKSTTAAQGLEMTVVLLQFIESYVAKNGPATAKKGRRA